MIELFQEQLEIIRERVDLALEAFDQGLISIECLYDARADSFEAENQYLSVLLEHNQKWASLQALMGRSSP